MKKKHVASAGMDELRLYTTADKMVLGVSTLLLALLFVVLMYPMLYAVISSFTKGVLPLNLIPRRITLEGYKACLDYRYIWTGFTNSI